MSTTAEFKEPEVAASRSVPADETLEPAMEKVRWVPLLSLPLAAFIVMAVHWWASKKESPVETQAYFIFLSIVLGLSIVGLFTQIAWKGLRRWMIEMNPIFAGALVLLSIWEAATSGLRLIPLPYFPGPPAVLYSIITDRAMLLESAAHSLRLLVGGYAMGALAGVASGICIGWYAGARRWGVPVLKVLGPIPAVAWIPLAMILFESSILSAMVLIAIAVWFPVTMLTFSAISNTRASYFDVARTLGAGQSYLIFRVAIPAAMPSIFIGLFMGICASFLTLVSAEKVGVKSGLGWYMEWAQTYAEYSKVYGALVIMAVFFSTIMTILFRFRDWMLVWQKGTIKW